MKIARLVLRVAQILYIGIVEPASKVFKLLSTSVTRLPLKITRILFQDKIMYLKKTSITFESSHFGNLNDIINLWS